LWSVAGTLIVALLLWGAASAQQVAINTKSIDHLEVIIGRIDRNVDYIRDRVDALHERGE
jgi:hypothetical protein